MKNQKRFLAVLITLISVLCLSGCCISHDWQEATCENPRTCAKCGKTEGEALGHKWKSATCTNPKTCSICGKTEGDVLGHKWKDATCTEEQICSVCGVHGNPALGHEPGDWEIKNEATTSHPGTKIRTCIRCGEQLDEEAYTLPVIFEWDKPLTLKMPLADVDVCVENINGEYAIELQTDDMNTSQLISFLGASTDDWGFDREVFQKQARFVLGKDDKEEVSGNKVTVSVEGYGIKWSLICNYKKSDPAYMRLQCNRKNQIEGIVTNDIK